MMSQEELGHAPARPFGSVAQWLYDLADPYVPVRVRELVTEVSLSNLLLAIELFEIVPHI
jgi:hypothetical protein